MAAEAERRNRRKADSEREESQLSKDNRYGNGSRTEITYRPADGGGRRLKTLAGVLQGRAVEALPAWDSLFPG